MERKTDTHSEIRAALHYPNYIHLHARGPPCIFEILVPYRVEINFHMLQTFVVFTDGSITMKKKNKEVF